MKSLIAAAALCVIATSAFAEGVTHKLAVHVDDSDKQKMNMALNNVQNTVDYYKEHGDDVIVEIVAYGPGLQIFIDGQSPVADRISTMALELENVSFSACGNTIANMKKKSGKDVTLLSEAKVVPSGVVRLIELQEDGFAYVRP